MLELTKTHWTLIGIVATAVVVAGSAAALPCLDLLGTKVCGA